MIDAFSIVFANKLKPTTAALVFLSSPREATFKA